MIILDVVSLCQNVVSLSLALSHIIFLCSVDLCIEDNIGTEFYILFLENEFTGNSPGTLEVSVVSAPSAFVSVQNPKSGWQESFTVTAGSVQSISIPSTFKARGSQRSDAGLYLFATSEVVVYGVNRESSTCGAFMVIPADVLSTRYVAVSYWPGFQSSQASQIGIMSTQDSNTVRVSFVQGRGRVRFEGNIYDSTRDLVFQLDKYESVQIQSISFADLSGTLITSTYDVAVFSGNNKTDIGEGSGADHVVEMIVPTVAYGKQYVIVPFPNRAASINGRIKLVATAPQTEVFNYGQVYMQ